MTRICCFTIPASRDIEQILDLVASQSGFDGSEKFLATFNQKCQRLAQFPMMGKSRAELGLGVRSFPYSPYLIFYHQIEGGVEILRVVSGYRNLSALFAEDNDE
jgi:toxin ParE1/3/4